MKSYLPSKKEEATIKRVYDDFDHMLNERRKRWRYLNDRTLKEYIEDSQLRLNGYVPTKEAQGKEPWQANVFHPVTRNKFKAMLAAVALDIPQIRITAQNEKSRKDHKRASIMRELVRFSFVGEDKEESAFFEAWENAEKGTVVVYDGYLKSTAKRKVITSFDPETGEVETEEQEVETDSQCFNQIIPLLNFYVYDFHIFDVQKQPCLVWMERKTREEFEQEYGKYKKSHFVPEGVPETDVNEDNSFFVERWQDRMDEDEPIEVLKYYNKLRDEFIVVANGVLILDVPLLLGKKKKMYPFAKTVFEPFGTQFFYGNSLPNTLMGEQDVINALWNMSIDKTYKSMTANLLIGNINKDDFDLEDQNTSVDTKIYVQDINQVKEMPIKGIDNSDVKMIELVSRGLDMSSVDSNQQGVPGRGVTAREVVIANENAKKLKGVLYLFLTKLWVQKINLRIYNVLTYYTKPKIQEIMGENNENNKLDKFLSYAIEGAELSDGSKGTLGVQIYPTEKDLPQQQELDIEEEVYTRQSNDKYEILAMTSDYLDDWKYDVKVVSESVFQQESGLSQLKMEQKLVALSTFFPNILMLNQEKLARDTVMAYEDDPEEYNFEAQPQTAGVMPGQEPGASEATAGQTGLPPLPKV